MAKERLYFTGSRRIIGDPRPSGLDMRVYACVSMHDGMSILKGTGRGCYATFATLTAEIGCDMANLSRSLKRLVEWGYLTEERQEDRRRKTFRVTFDTEEAWPNRQRAAVQIVGQTANRPPENVGETATDIVGNAQSRNGGNLRPGGQHYSSLKGLDPLKEKLNSSEEARFAARDLLQVNSGLSDEANLSRLDRELTTGGQIDRVAWRVFLDRLDPKDVRTAARIQRLGEELYSRMSDGEVAASVAQAGANSSS